MKVLACIALSFFSTAVVALDLEHRGLRIKEREYGEYDVDVSVSVAEALRILQDDDGGFFCNRATSAIQDVLENTLPFKFSCGCNFRLFQSTFPWINPRATYGCSAEFCVNDFLDLFPVDLDSIPMPITDDTCMTPGIWGTADELLRSQSLDSKICTGNTTTIGINITEIEEFVGFDISDEDVIRQDLPEMCLSVEHSIEELTTFKSCSFTIADDDCPCTVCDEGTGVQLDCTELISANVPDVLEPLVNETVVCLSPGIFDGGSEGTGGFALFRPFLVISKPAEAPSP